MWLIISSYIDVIESYLWRHDRPECRQFMSLWAPNHWHVKIRLFWPHFQTLQTFWHGTGSRADILLLVGELFFKLHYVYTAWTENLFHKTVDQIVLQATTLSLARLLHGLIEELNINVPVGFVSINVCCYRGPIV